MNMLNVGIDGVDKELNYFQRNREKMRYGEFREKGYFVGSGVVEAGCKTVIGQRAKLSGMRWSEDGRSDSRPIDSLPYQK
jgi:hypothetical protein